MRHHVRAARRQVFRMIDVICGPRSYGLQIAAAAWTAYEQNGRGALIFDGDEIDAFVRLCRMGALTKRTGFALSYASAEDAALDRKARKVVAEYDPDHTYVVGVAVRCNPAEPIRRRFFYRVIESQPRPARCAREMSVGGFAISNPANTPRREWTMVGASKNVDDLSEQFQAFSQDNWLKIASFGWRNFQKRGRGAVVIPARVVEAVAEGDYSPFSLEYLTLPDEEEGEGLVDSLVRDYDPEQGVVLLFVWPSSFRKGPGGSNAVRLWGRHAAWKKGGKPCPPDAAALEVAGSGSSA